MSKMQRSIRLSPEADETLRVMAVRNERSVSQLIEMAVRSQYMAPSGSRSTDGRESVQTKAAREQGSHWPTGNTRQALNLERQRKMNEKRS